MAEGGKIVTSDPEKYRLMSEPRKRDEVNASLDGFLHDLRALREKHHIADLTVIISAMVDYDGSVARASTYGHIGDALQQEPMLAWALGKAQAEHRERINKLLAGIPDK